MKLARLQLLEYDSCAWDTHDPNGVLSYEKGTFNLSILKLSGGIDPREDLLYLENKQSQIVIDYGYYGCEVKLNGEWVVYVIDGKVEEPWKSPLEKHSFPFDKFLEGIKQIQCLLDKYT